MHWPQLEPFLFLCFHVGLLLKGRFWAKITVTHAPPLGSFNPHVIHSWIML